MKCHLLFIVLVAIAFYSFPSAATGVWICSPVGYSILTINGVFTDEAGARKNKEALEQVIVLATNNYFNSEPITVDYLHNPSHLGGLGDLLKVVQQGLLDSETIDDYDLREMLLAASEKVKTQKLLLVAHSQGNFYANSFYDMVVGQDGGVPVESIGAYSVATPSGRVAGGGKWFTSHTDKVIAELLGRFLARPIMPPNTSIALQAGDDWLGHNFSDVYLKYGGARIISDIQSALSGLKTNEIQSPDGPCISPPRLTLAHKLKRAAFNTLDPIADALRDTSVYLAASIYNIGAFIVNSASLAVDSIFRDAFTPLGSGGYDFNNLGGLTLAVFDKFVAVVGPGQTSVALRSESAAASVPSQPNRTELTQAPAPITVSQVAVVTKANNQEPLNPNISPEGEVAGATASSENVNTPIVWGVSATPPPNGGGVNVSGGEPAPADGGPTPNESTSTGELPATSYPITISGFVAAFVLDRLEVDLSWTASPEGAAAYFISRIDGATSTPVAETSATSLSVPVPSYGATFTYSVEARDAEGNVLSNAPTASVAVPDLLTDIQPLKDAKSFSSWLSENWYNLGTGFYGTVYAFVFEGGVEGGNDPNALQDSQIFLQEYLDPAYTIKNREFTISNGMDFTREFKEVIIKGLNIPLQPNKYYRLWTYNTRQNAYVALGGTLNPPCESPCGDAMWIKNNGGMFGPPPTREIYRFYPYIRAVMQKNFPEQSAPSAPQITALNFDQFNLTLGVEWASSTDPDTTDNLIKYEFNYSTSGELLPDGWQDVGSGRSSGIQLEFPNSYTIGVYAKDDFDNTSSPTITTWNFPAGFAQYILSSSLGTGDQYFNISPGGTISSVKLYTAEISTTARFVESVSCVLQLFDADNPNELLAQSDTALAGLGCQGEPVFSFSLPPEIVAGHSYFWRMYVTTGNHTTSASIKFWGTMLNTAGGLFSHQSLVNARFEVKSGNGTLFSN